MKQLPETVQAYKRTPRFTATTVPAGLLRRHNTKAGVWGLIVVTRGAMTYRILEPGITEYRLDTDHPGVVEPTVWHEVAPIADCEFYLEFYR